MRSPLLRRERRGAGAVEFDFIAPLAILIAFGAIATARPSESQLEATALEGADLPVAATTAAASWNPDNSPGGIVTVTMQHTPSAR